MLFAQVIMFTMAELSLIGEQVSGVRCQVSVYIACNSCGEKDFIYSSKLKLIDLRKRKNKHAFNLHAIF